MKWQVVDLEVGQGGQKLTYLFLGEIKGLRDELVVRK